MAMVCYKNGSLTRQHFRDLHAGGSWDEFNALLQKAPIGTSPNSLDARTQLSARSQVALNDITRTYQGTTARSASSSRR